MAYPTKPKYKLIKNKGTNEVDSVDLAINLQDDGSYTKFSIPFKAGNADYKEYLEWVNEGNTAEAAD